MSRVRQEIENYLNLLDEYHLRMVLSFLKAFFD